MNINSLDWHIVPLDMKGCICHFAKWQIHPFISKGTICFDSYCANVNNLYPFEVVGRDNGTQIHQKIKCSAFNGSS